MLENMNEVDARKFNDGIAKNGHPLLLWDSYESIQIVKWMDEFLSEYVKPNKRLLDLGCGSGKHTYKAELLGLECTGIDISDEMIRRANENKNRLLAKSKFINGSYYNLQMEDNYFDYVLFPKNIIECSYTEFEKLINEIYRILNDVGLLFITMKDDKTENRIKYSQSGERISKVNIPDVGAYDYPTYFWTIGFVLFIASKKFVLLDTKTMGEIKESRLLVFMKKR
jgi:SAM-dependent methyltransferase